MLRLFLIFFIYTSIVIAVEVPIVDNAPQIDGIMNDPYWEMATIITDFYQQFPKSGERPNEPTEIRILQDKENIYFGVICYGDTSELIRRQNKRDTNVFEDDSIEIFLSTLSDESAYYFAVNTLNIQLDGIYLARNNNYDRSWDGIWISMVRVDNDKWTAEIKIPFRSLRYGRGDEWGLNIVRYNYTAKETTCPFAYDSDFCDTKRFGLLSVLDLPHNVTFDIIPYVMVNRVGEESDGSLIYEVEKKGGFDVKTTVMGNLTGNFTLNPDYAQIESDPNEINLSKEEIYLSEKRPFFLESADEFNLPHQLFYSRRISDIWTGTKIIGKMGRASYGFLHCYLKDVDPRFPSANVMISRMRFSMAEDLTFAGSYTGAISSLDYNHMVEFDGKVDITDSVLVQGVYAHSFVKDTYEDDSGAFLMDRFDGWLTTATLSYRGSHSNFNTIFLASSPRFDNQLGILQYSGIGVIGVTNYGSHSWGFSKGLLESVNLEFFFAIDRNIGNTEVSVSGNGNCDFSFRRNWGLWVDSSAQRDAYLTDEGEPVYRNWSVGGGGWLFPVSIAGFSIGYEYGKVYEYERYFALNGRFAITPYPGFDISFGPQIVFPG
ncbi:MAG: DUF5916 domain-containing protein [bacterium]